MIKAVIASLLMFAVIDGFVNVILTIFDTVEQFGDELHDYFEDED